MQHSVRLVEDEHLKRGEIDFLAFQQIDQTPRRCDDDMDALAQGFDLRLLVNSAVDRGHPDRETLAVIADVSHDLHRQLAGWSKNQGLHSGELPRLVGEGKAVQHRQHEGRRFPSPCLSDGDQVSTLHHFGDGGGLHWRWTGVARFLNVAEDAGFESELAERHACIIGRSHRRWHGLKPRGSQALHFE